LPDAEIFIIKGGKRPSPLFPGYVGLNSNLPAPTIASKIPAPRHINFIYPEAGIITAAGKAVIIYRLPFLKFHPAGAAR